jgi:hypothetical protein
VCDLKYQMEKRSMAHFAGLDVSVKETSICIVDDTGRRGYSLSRALLAPYLAKLSWPAVPACGANRGRPRRSGAYRRVTIAGTSAALANNKQVQTAYLWVRW